MTETTNGHVAERPRDIAHCVSAYLQEGDLDGLVSLFHADCEIYFPPGAPPSTGRDGARAAFENFLSLKPTIESDIVSEVVVGDIALTRANWRLVTADGSVLGEGQSTEVAKRFDHGGWGYLIDCPNGPPTLE